VLNFPGVGHSIKTNRPDQFARMVSDFLESLD